VTHTDNLLHLIETIAAKDSSGVVERAELREAALMLGIFPEHRFRQALHQALTRLAAQGRIDLDKELIALV
jgi:predicted transcriptional regulator